MNLTRRESEIVAAILSYLRTVPGVVAWRSNVGAVQTGTRFVRFGFAGCADIVGWKTEIVGYRQSRVDFRETEPITVARFIAVEVKRPGQQPTPKQRAFLEMVAKAGGLALVAHDVQDVVEALGR